MNLGEKIYELRKKNNLTQEMLADSLYVSAQAVSKWERGVANPDLELIPAMAALFGVSADELLGMSVKNDNRVATEMLEQRIIYLERLVDMLMSGDSEDALETSLSECNALESFDFTSMTESELSKWRLENAKIIESENKIVFETTPKWKTVGRVIDPQIVNKKMDLDIRAVNRIIIKFRSFSTSHKDTLEIFYTTKNHPNWDRQKMISYPYFTGQTCSADIIFTSPSWDDTLTQLRIDTTLGYSERSEIEYVALVDENGEVKYSCSFSDPSDPEIKNWEVVNATAIPCQTALAYRTEWVDNKQAVYDPMIYNNNLFFEIGKTKHIHIRMRVDLDDPNSRVWTINNKFYNSYLKLYFKTEASNEYSEQKHIRVDYVAGCGMIDLYADMSSNAFWRGILTGLRLDPVELVGAKIELALIEILEPTAVVRSASMLKSLQDRMQSIELVVDSIQDRVDDLECRIEDIE